MKVKSNAYRKTYDTDGVARKTWLCLLKDFRKFEGLDFCASAHREFMAGIPTFRGYSFPDIGYVSPFRFRAYKQLAGLFKKYRFQQDLYTDDELEALTHQKFMDEQVHFSTFTPLSELGHRVAQRARSIARRILGKYNPEDTVLLARFGKKSSIGCPLSLAYIDHKLTDVKAFTGSSECSSWFFESVLPQDEILKSLVVAMGITSPIDNRKLQHNSLKLVNVPKSWKVHRSITPLTLLSLFYSYGVGSQVENCLESEGLCISDLQMRHRMLVKKFSISRSHATADLTSASQSLTSDTLNRVLPREWYVAIRRTFSRQLDCKVNGRKSTMYTSSVLPMGNGLTFPVETLVFYCILKSIQELTGVQGLISVYGDDLIYPSKLHKYVVRIFPEFRFILNLDKTFVSAYFRESCGSDYYRGVDSRPAMLPQAQINATPTQHLSWLYKAYNALSRRWSEDEISSTLYMLLTEIAMVTSKIHRVPPSYPDTAGIKVDTPSKIPLGASVLPWLPIKLRFTNGSRWFQFSFMSAVAPKRAVESVLPYYWLALNGGDDIPKEYDNFWETDFSTLHPHEPRSTGLCWTKYKRTRWVRRKNGKGKRKIRTVRYRPESAVKSFTLLTEVQSPNGGGRDGIHNSDWI
jgi:hypothetical protein